MTALLVLAYLGTIVLANVMITVFGVVPVGLGLMAPAGVYAAGLAFTLRDLVHDRLGWRGTVGAILAGAVLSAGLSPRLALASGTAFLLSELLDLAVYAPLRRRQWLTAVVASNLVGLTLDSLVFLWLAFGSLEFLLGQIVGKAWMTALTVGAYALLARRSLRPLAQ
jgi:queuosine precursor transporter